MHFFNAFIVPLLALASTGDAAPAPKGPAETNVEATQGRVPQYYCAHAYHIMYTRYIVKGRGSPVREKELKKAIYKAPLCSITSWSYHEGDDGMGYNDFDLTFDFPIFCQARLEKVLIKTLGQGIACPQIDGAHDKPLVGLHDDISPHSSK